MALIGRLHPLLIHFPIVLVLMAGASELAASATADVGWRRVAISHLRVASGFALLAAIAGWRLSSELAMDKESLVEWHRWIAIAGLVATIAAALTGNADAVNTSLKVRIYRISVCVAVMLVALAGHLGGILVWGADFLRL